VATHRDEGLQHDTLGVRHPQHLARYKLEGELLESVDGEHCDVLVAVARANGEARREVAPDRDPENGGAVHVDACDLDDFLQTKDARTLDAFEKEASKQKNRYEQQKNRAHKSE
jgi:hypothetical protein